MTLEESKTVHSLFQPALDILISKGFEIVERNKQYCFATLLNPQTKMRIFVDTFGHGGIEFQKPYYFMSLNRDNLKKLVTLV